MKRSVILAATLLVLGQVTPIHHDRIDGYVADEHIDWTDTDENFKTSGTFHLTTAKTPSTAYDTGVTGQIAWDTSYIYVCTATNTWERAAIATWGDVLEYLLLETGDRLLLETGDKLKLESSS